MGIFSGITNALGITHKAPSMGPLAADKYKYDIDPNAFLNQYGTTDRASLQQALLSQQTQNLQNDQARQQQMALAQQLQGNINGPSGPSLAQLQMQAGSEDAIKQQAAMLASNNGISAGLGARLAAQQGANLQQQNVAATGQLRAAEEAQNYQNRLASQNSLANVLAGTRQGDINSTGLQQDMMKYYQQALLDQAENERQAQMARQQLGAQLATGQMNSAAGQFQNNQNARVTQNGQNSIGAMGFLKGVGNVLGLGSTKG